MVQYESVKGGQPGQALQDLFHASVVDLIVCDVVKTYASGEGERCIKRGTAERADMSRNMRVYLVVRKI